MNPELKNISDHIHYMGIGVLSQAQRNSLYTSYGYDSLLDEGVYGVLQAAHAAELIIKAAIAEQHPLLIFSSLPKSRKGDDSFLSLSDLFESGKTIQYSELPEKLWAATGYKIEDISLFNSFGKLRNCIQHFATPDIDLRTETSRFIYLVIDPILEHFWGEYAVEYVDLESYQDDVFGILKSRGLVVRFPESMAKYADGVDEL
ncbi:hypothetical protein [Vibrio parahaemolyticus]|uniref:hypothetical protein n=1 Tax=Vibrio parahaemolyticus TaxID=670 RepID=UPI001A29A1AB|nr:hypothetical protein [Vibrio parahaemolyticus]EGR0400116.1 hypothetical protein [Vibrio parahaemolyticus]MCI9720674.1 hypothetical protein [Vibrio parahaemolyticus]HAS6434619.1 hypothetical protein [Vibrio parahaemolyticus]HAS6854081.1 hypothetical protein [Vibrio parahaemolyticus]HAS6962253.1 hypothetical protein [Vibrio parahaemolyticus]